MRIDRLDLIACGPFTEQSLDLSQGEQGLHLIWGGNEAGKSSALKAVCDALFGFPERHPGNFKHNNDSLKVGLSLRAADGEVISFVRRKARVRSLRHPSTDQPLPDDLLAPFLGTLDRTLFLKMFGITHKALGEGGAEMLKTSSDIGQLLFSAAGSTSNVRKVVEKLTASAEALFKPRGQNPVINSALAKLRDLNEGLKQSKTPSARVDVLQRDIKKLEDRLIELRESQTRIQVQRHRLQTLQRLRVPLQQREVLTTELQALRDVRRLSDRFDEVLADALGRRHTTIALRDKAVSRCERLTLSLSRPETASETLAHEDEIRRLSERAGSYEAAMRDLPTLKIKADRKQQDAQELLDRIRPNLELSEARRLRLSRGLRSDLEPLIKTHTALEARSAEYRQELTSVESELALLERQLDELAVSPIPDLALNVLESHASLQATLEQWATTREAFAANEQELLAEMNQLIPGLANIDEMESLQVPTLGQLEQFEEERQSFQTARERIAERTREQQEKREQASQALIALRAHSGELPTLSDLQTAREMRDRVWQLLRKQLQGEPIDQAQLEATLTELASKSLISSYEQTMSQADSIADRLRLDAQAVAEQIQHTTLISFCDERVSLLESERQSLELGWEQSLKNWRNLWAKFDSKWEQPKEARRWLDRWNQLKKKLPKHRRDQTQRDQLQDSYQKTVQKLDDAWRSLQGEAAVPPADPIDLIKQMKREVERREKSARDREQLLSLLQKSREELSRRTKQLEKLAKEQHAWREAWAPRVLQLGLSADASAARAEGVLEELATLEGWLDELLGTEGLTVRIEQMERERKSFETQVQQLSARCGTHDAASSPLDTLRRLRLECEEARRDRDQQEQDREELKRVQDEIANLEAEYEAIRQTLQGLLDEAGCEREEELSERWQAYQRLKKIEQQQRDNRDEIDRVAEGMELDEAATELKQHSAPVLAAELDSLEHQWNDGHREIGEHQQSLGALRNELGSIGSGEGAIDFVAQIEKLTAQIESDSMEWLRLRTASYVLNRAVKQFQEKNQDPMLERAGDIFSRLTLGSFEGLTVNFDEGEPTLVGKRGHELVGVSGMSAGTADQLFLSLRLAYLDQWLRKSEPVPLIVDDILITFDDRRAAATLEVLAEFSKLTQVILFTHHEHLVELAKSTLSPTEWGPSLFDHPLAK